MTYKSVLIVWKRKKQCQEERALARRESAVITRTKPAWPSQLVDALACSDKAATPSRSVSEPVPSLPPSSNTSPARSWNSPATLLKKLRRRPLLLATFSSPSATMRSLQSWWQPPRSPQAVASLMFRLSYLLSRVSLVPKLLPIPLKRCELR